MISFILAVAFIVFVILVYKYCGKIIVDALDKKIHQTVKNLNEAQNLKLEAHNSLEEAKMQLQETNILAKEIIENASTQAETIIKKAQQEVEDLKRKKQKMHNAKLEQQQKQILESLNNQIIELALNQVKIDFEVNKPKDLFNRNIEEFEHIVN